MSPVAPGWKGVVFATRDRETGTKFVEMVLAMGSK